MLELLYKIFIGHNHKWNIIQTYKRQTRIGDGGGNVVKLLQCEHCGKIKTFEIS